MAAHSDYGLEVQSTRRLVLVVLVLVIIPAMVSAAVGGLRLFTKDAGLFDPSRGPVKISFALLQDASLVEVAVIDLRNQVVRHFNLVELRAGDHSFHWDGMGEDGQKLAEGPYKIVLRARLEDGRQESREINTRIASLDENARQEIPSVLPPENHNYSIKGSVSSFWRHNMDKDQGTQEGEMRFRNQISYRDKTRIGHAVFDAIQPIYDGEASYDGSHAFLEQEWGEGRLRGVFREGLGSFDDPMKLFSDFRTERKKIGLQLEQNRGFLKTNALAFQSEKNVGRNEQGVASRIVMESNKGWRLGSTYTYRKGDDAEGYKNRRSHAMALDADIPLGEDLALEAEAAGTREDGGRWDFGFLIGTGYKYKTLQFALGYLDLGEEFGAPFADPLRYIQKDAQGFEAEFDWAIATPWQFVAMPAIAVSYFNLERQSDKQRIQEIDASVRSGLGTRSSLFASWLWRNEGGGSNHSLLISLDRKWSTIWSMQLESHLNFADRNRTRRCSLGVNFQRKSDSGRLALEMIDRRLDDDHKSPYRQAALRLDYDSERCGVQLQTSYNHNSEDSGVNVFGRMEYRPVFLHRYEFLTYTSLGNRAATSFEQQIEFGMEIAF